MSKASCEPKLFTIGHSTRDAAAFVALLKEYGITAVADVRSTPYSRRYPQFNRDALKSSLEACQIAYLFLGIELGARRKEPECFVDGVARYDRIAATGAFAFGIQRLRSDLGSHQIALLCAEKDPLTCHRMILVCRQLRSDVTITHIIGPGECETQQQAEDRLLKLAGLSAPDLFRTNTEILEEACNWQGEKIAWRNSSLVKEGDLSW